MMSDMNSLTPVSNCSWQLAVYELLCLRISPSHERGSSHITQWLLAEAIITPGDSWLYSTAMTLCTVIFGDWPWRADVVAWSASEAGLSYSCASLQHKQEILGRGFPDHFLRKLGLDYIPS